MSGGVTVGRRTLLTALLDYLIEPVEASTIDRVVESPRMSHPIVAVVGLGPGCGTTTVARALGVELALRDPEGAGVVTSEVVPSGGIPLGAPAASRLTRALGRRLPVNARAAGRLCLAGQAESLPLVEATRDLASLVIDVGDPADAPIAASLADAVVIVAGPRTEPSLADLVAASLERVGPQPLIVLNRPRAAFERWEGRDAPCLPESRIGARLALGGHSARGPFGAAVADIANLVESAA
jgi:hypothetical protein